MCIGCGCVTTGYLVIALLGWVVLHHKPPASYWRWPWLLLLASDIADHLPLTEMQLGKMHYTPLLALPILTVSVLGHMRLALATTASITLILLGIDIFMHGSGRAFLVKAICRLPWSAQVFLPWPT